MEIAINNLEKVTLGYLKKLQSVEGDLEIAKRVVNNNERAVIYFMGEFSNPFLDYIGKEIMKVEGIYINNVLCYYPAITGTYYEFIGAKFVDNKPTWHKVSLYKGVGDNNGKPARLYTYINTITVRYFVNLYKKMEKNREISMEDLLETTGVSILKDYDGFDEISLDDDNPMLDELNVAWEKLPEKDRLILRYLVIEERNPLEIFDEMIQYVETTIAPEQYNRKQKQDAMSLMKQRAKLHLRKLIVEQRKQKKQ